MRDTTNKTPGQVAYETWVTTRHNPEDRMALWEKVAAAVLAHAAPKWHPVSEPVPKTDRYWVRTRDGNITQSIGHAGETFLRCAYTHWSGPIEPPPFQEKP